MSGPSMLRRDKEKKKITAVTASKPNFQHVGLSVSVVEFLIVRSTLVLVLVTPSVIVRETLI